MEHQVRDARLTDIDRITGLIEASRPALDARATLGAADLLRQMVYLPQVVSSWPTAGWSSGRRSSRCGRRLAAGGLVGSIDLLAVEPGHELDGVIEALLGETIRTARNKGCVVLESRDPNDAATLTRWEGRASAKPVRVCAARSRGPRRSTVGSSAAT